MRKSKLGIQALSPDGKALEWVKRYKPRVFKVVIVSPGDFVGWMPQIPEKTFVVGRYFGDGNIDYLPWTPENGVMLADRIKIVHDMNHGRVDAWEAVNEPVVHTVEAMRRLAEFQRVWAESMRDKGLSPIVGNFSVGNPKVLSADGINLMQHFREAMRVGDYFASHGYGCPEAMSDPKWQALRYRELFLDAGMTMPVILTECGRDCGSTGHGYKEKYSDEQYIPQLIQLDQALQADPLVKGATIFCYGAWGWKTFDLTQNAARLVGEYIVSQGDIEEEEDVGTKIKVLVGSLIQTMDLEEYIRGVVPREALASWGDAPNGMEVLKAQAIAARTYAAYSIFHPRHGNAAVCTGPHCQVWTPATDPRTDRAVRDTEGAFVTKGGEIIQTQYVSRCGLPQCPECEGRNGYDGKVWYGRMCQWGARALAVEYGKTWREILQFYYPDADWGPGPEPEPEFDVDKCGEWLRDWLWDDLGVPYNPAAAFPAHARALGWGRPLAPEGRCWYDHIIIAYQPFALGLLFCREHDWSNINAWRW